MDNKTILWAAGSMLVGVAVGGVVGYTLAKKQMTDQIEEERSAEEAYKLYSQKSEENKSDSTPKKTVVVNSAKIAMPGQPGINYTNYAKAKAEETKKAEAESPVEDDVEETEEIEPEMETYEERLAREEAEFDAQSELYLKKKGDKIEPLGKEPIDDDYPEVHYPSEELYYFTEEDLFTTEFNEVIDNEEELLGRKLRQMGWMMSNKSDEIWVRNNPRETDYHIIKVKDTHDHYWAC